MILQNKTQRNRLGRKSIQPAGRSRYIAVYMVRASSNTRLAAPTTPLRSMSAAGRIVSMQSDKRTLKEAKMGDEVAMAISGPMVGRHFNEEDVLYIDLPEHKVPELRKGELSVEEHEVLEHIIQVKRKEKPTWGMG